MAFNLVILSCLLSVAYAGFLPYGHVHYAAPTIIKHIQPTIVKEVQAAPEAPANYDFHYDVNDDHTGDVHSQHETAKDGAISGSYELNDSDGFRRIVEYTADDEHGFQANVRREPLAPAPAPVPAPTIIKKIIQPTITKIIAAPAHNPWYHGHAYQAHAHYPW